MRHETQAEIVRTVSPGRLATWESDLLVPVGQALSIALAVGLAAGVVVLTLIGPARGLSGGDLWAAAGRVAGTAAALSLALTVIAFVLQHRRVILSIEEWTGRDLDGDGVIGEPEPRRVRVELHDASKQQTRYVDLPASDAELRAVAVAVLRNGRAFSRPALAGIVSQRTYNRLAREMERRGLVHRLPGKRRQLSAAGRACLRKVLED